MMNPFLVMAQQGKSAQQVAQDTMLRNMKINQKAAQKEANKTGQPVYWNQGPMKGSITSMGGVQQPWAAEPPKTAATPKTAAPSQPLASGSGYSGGGGGMMMPPIMMPPIPEPEPQKFAPGGVGTTIDTNAKGFRRKKSSARLAGLTSKGTSQFKIAGQSAKSSGLNIGI